MDNAFYYTNWPARYPLMVSHLCGNISLVLISIELKQELGIYFKLHTY